LESCERDRKLANEGSASFSLSLVLYRSLAQSTPQNQVQSSPITLQQVEHSPIHFIS